MRFGTRTFLATTLVFAFAGCGAVGSTPRGIVADKPMDDALIDFLQDVRVAEAGDNVVVLVTARGMVAMEMRNAKTPVTAAAIEELVKQGFYNGLTFHRVERKFLVQTGDPSGGTARSTGAKKLPLEINGDLTNGVRGAVGMARPEDDPNGADSQFYILLSGRPSLDGQYTVFGNVVKGMEVVDAITQGDRISEAYVVTGISATAAPSAAPGAITPPTSPLVQ